jgi:hypothetical protein
MEAEPLWPGSQQGLLHSSDRARSTGEQPAYWWVNQGSSYSRASKGGYLWAPRKNKQGRTYPYWKNMTLLQKGDRVFHYRNGAI